METITKKVLGGKSRNLRYLKNRSVYHERYTAFSFLSYNKEKVSGEYQAHSHGYDSILRLDISSVRHGNHFHYHDDINSYLHFGQV